MKCIIYLLALAATGCTSTVQVPEPPTGLIASPDGGAPGYQFGPDRSHFLVGARGKRSAEHGYRKLTGADGTIAVDVLNGSEYGVPKARSPAQKLAPFGKSPAEHDGFVRDYFVKRGFPADQIGEIQGRTLIVVTGRGDEMERPSPKAVAYYSSMQRVVDGIPVADSFAWARVNAQGQIVEEAVYWPALPANVLAQARRMREAWRDEKRRHELADRLHMDSRARIAIRHSSASSQDPFEAIASLDVYVKSAAAHDVVAPVSYVRHFDVDGKELFLPQERAQPVRSHPERKAPPGAAAEASAKR